MSKPCLVLVLFLLALGCVSEPDPVFLATTRVVAEAGWELGTLITQSDAQPEANQAQADTTLETLVESTFDAQPDNQPDGGTGDVLGDLILDTQAEPDAQPDTNNDAVEEVACCVRNVVMDPYCDTDEAPTAWNCPEGCLPQECNRADAHPAGDTFNTVSCCP